MITTQEAQNILVYKIRVLQAEVKELAKYAEQLNEDNIHSQTFNRIRMHVTELPLQLGQIQQAASTLNASEHKDISHG